MNKLEDKIKDFEYYKEKFSKWIATEQIIDDKKAFYMLKKTEYEKVCLYRDGCNMFIYGDYGQYTFDDMTWLGSPYNLKYDNIGYQLEKMERKCKQSLYKFDEEKCVEDIKEWFEDNINYDNYKEISNNLFNKLNNNKYLDIEKFCKKNNCIGLEELIDFVNQCYENSSESDWIHFLQNSELDNFDELYESSLWNAGKIICQNFYISLYALKICGEKLLKIKGEIK